MLIFLFTYNMVVVIMYKLSNLRYLYQDLEPFIDTQTIGLHYQKHAKNYLNKLNSLLNSSGYDYRYNLKELVYHIDEFSINDQSDILFNLGGVLNHDLYFKSMNPMHNLPTGKLNYYINNKYGNYGNFWKEIKAKALSLKGSGYVFVVLKNNDLDIITMTNQETPLSFGYVPLFNIDMWEHAYYLNYKNNKEEYLDNFKMIADFTNASQIFNSIVK